ncbi:MAG: MmcQ/YjbR family DNA-binding protein [SAR324 cluster bacterium]|nr:MmcQ/YjbR family DNA-binding protein [SAR324 cluster bacterium]
MQQRGAIQTLYEDREKKGISVKFNPEAASEIEAYMNGLEEMIEAYKDNPDIINGLHEVKVKANTLLISHTPEDEIIQGIRQMTTISGPDGKKINIANFGKGKSEQIQDVDVFKEKTLRKLNQTITNTISLLQWKENEGLAQFVNQLKALDQTVSGEELDKSVRNVLQSGGFNLYRTAKDEYIKEWLRPFQDLLGKPIESLTQADMQDAMKHMKIVMNQRLNEGNLVVHPNPDQLKEFNVKNHDMVHGDSQVFWLSNPLMDEFVNFTQAVLARFTFMLDKQYLIFRFKSEPYLYLIGFSNEAFLKAEKGEDSSLTISPHIKAIIQGKDKAYRELNQTNFPSVGMYIDVLKDTIKPFLTGLAEKIEFEFSPEFKKHFKM